MALANSPFLKIYASTLVFNLNRQDYKKQKISVLIELPNRHLLLSTFTKRHTYVGVALHLNMTNLLFRNRLFFYMVLDVSLLTKLDNGICTIIIEFLEF